MVVRVDIGEILLSKYADVSILQIKLKALSVEWKHSTTKRGKRGDKADQEDTPSWRKPNREKERKSPRWSTKQDPKHNQERLGSS